MRIIRLSFVLIMISLSWPANSAQERRFSYISAHAGALRPIADAVVKVFDRSGLLILQTSTNSNGVSHIPYSAVSGFGITIHVSGGFVDGKPYANSLSAKYSALDVKEHSVLYVDHITNIIKRLSEKRKISVVRSRKLVESAFGIDDSSSGFFRTVAETRFSGKAFEDIASGHESIARYIDDVVIPSILNNTHQPLPSYLPTNNGLSPRVISSRALADIISIGTTLLNGAIGQAGSSIACDVLGPNILSSCTNSSDINTVLNLVQNASTQLATVLSNQDIAILGIYQTKYAVSVANLVSDSNKIDLANEVFLQYLKTITGSGTVTPQQQASLAKDSYNQISGLVNSSLVTDFDGLLNNGGGVDGALNSLYKLYNITYNGWYGQGEIAQLSNTVQYWSAHQALGAVLNFQVLLAPCHDQTSQSQASCPDLTAQINHVNETAAGIATYIPKAVAKNEFVVPSINKAYSIGQWWGGQPPCNISNFPVPCGPVNISYANDIYNYSGFGTSNMETPNCSVTAPYNGPVWNNLPQGDGWDWGNGRTMNYISYQLTLYDWFSNSGAQLYNPVSQSFGGMSLSTSSVDFKWLSFTRPSGIPNVTTPIAALLSTNQSGTGPVSYIVAQDSWLGINIQQKGFVDEAYSQTICNGFATGQSVNSSGQIVVNPLVYRSYSTAQNGL